MKTLKLTLSELLLIVILSHVILKITNKTDFIRKFML